MVNCRDLPIWNSESDTENIDSCLEGVSEIIEKKK